MKTLFNKITFMLLSGVIMLSISSCKKDFINPAAVPTSQVFNDARGITGVAIGIQRRYEVSRAGSLYNLVTANGFITKELIILNVGNTSEAQLNTGGTSVDGTNSILGNLWANSNKIIFDADQVISAATGLADKNYASGLIGYVSIFKALALGNMSMFWEKIPAGNGSNVNFITRNDGFIKAIQVINDALAANTTNPITGTFGSNIPAGIDIINSLQALKARYSLYIGNYTQAFTAASAVDLTKKSTMNFDNANLNPIFETATSTNNVYQPVDSTLGLVVGIQPDLADKRVPFYTAINATIAPRFRINGFAAASTTPFPIYLPGEMTLIKAECLTRQAVPDLVNALVELNKVVTKKAAQDPLGVGADLPMMVGVFTQSQLLDEIYKNRCIELFMSGLKLEDMRRFGRALSERRRNFFPYPFSERDNNLNTPPDPPF